MDESFVTPPENNIQTNILKLKVLKGTNISKKNIFHTKYNSYVKVFICGKGETPEDAHRFYRSRVVKKNFNPLWNLQITSEVDPDEDGIFIKVFLRKKLFKDECLGIICLHLSKLKIPPEIPGIDAKPVIFEIPKNGLSTTSNHPSTIHLCLEYSTKTSTFKDASINSPNFKYKLMKPKNGDESLPPGWLMSSTADGKLFFLNHDLQITTWRDPRIKTEEDLLGPLPENWEEFVNEDGSLFYVDHLNKKTQWEDPRLRKFDGPDIHYSVEFKEKHENFIRELGVVLGTLKLKVRRENIFKDSYKRIASKDGIDLKQKLKVKFVTEEGLDGGGMAREWFYLLSRQMFDPQYGLFEYSSKGSYDVQINPSSGLSTNSHLSIFHFIGKVCAMAIYHRKLVEATFTQVFYKMMLGEEIGLEDIKRDDEEYYNSLHWILSNDPEIIDLTFCVTEDAMGQKIEKALKPDGEKIKLTNENKKEYVDLILKRKFVDRVKDQMDSFMNGFSDVFPPTMLKVFTPQELKVVLSGLPQISVSDWKANTKYRGVYQSNHPVVLRFWKVAYLLNGEQRSLLLRFVTGTPRVPVNGFAELASSDGGQPFTIEDWGDCSQLPLARTCFNRLLLPPYQTFEEMNDKIRWAIGNAECFDGVD